MEAGHLRFSGHLPSSFFRLHHIILDATQINLHLLGLGSVHAKHYRIVGKHTRIGTAVNVGHRGVGTLRETLPLERLSRSM